MASEVTNYQCPACTGPLRFEGKSGMMECEYCGSKYSVAEIEAAFAQKEQKAEEAFNKAEQKREEKVAERVEGWDTSNLSEEWGTDANGMRAYGCPSCGAQIICDATTAATACPYCGNPSVVPGQFGGTMKPDLIVPFKLDKQAAKDAYHRHISGRKLLPRLFKSENHIDEIKGVYVPFWLFDADVYADVSYRAQNVRSWSDGNYNYTETTTYSVDRSGDMSFYRVPVDGSAKMPNEFMEAIEPFNYGEAKEFSTAYLAGYMADKYDVGVADSQQRAVDRMKTSAEQAMMSTVTGYSSVTPVRSDIRLHNGTVHYALMPVWMLNSTYRGKRYTFAMNGQTGMMVGDLPVSVGRYWMWWAICALGITAAAFALMSFLF